VICLLLKIAAKPGDRSIVRNDMHSLSHTLISDTQVLVAEVESMSYRGGSDSRGLGYKLTSNRIPQAFPLPAPTTSHMKLRGGCAFYTAGDGVQQGEGGKALVSSASW
jgi:hypothetical protein